jgi:short-subunit dehydrogenase
VVRVLEVNLTGPFLTIKHAARRMGEGGSIVVTASLNAVQPGIGMGAYCSSKAGVAMLAEVAALELGPAGIRVNAVGPGLVRTGLTEGAFGLPASSRLRENTPLGRHATPEEIAVRRLAGIRRVVHVGLAYLIDGGSHDALPRCHRDPAAPRWSNNIRPTGRPAVTRVRDGQARPPDVLVVAAALMPTARRRATGAIRSRTWPRCLRRRRRRSADRHVA